MCRMIDLTGLRLKTYAASMAHLRREAARLGVRDVLTTNLRSHAGCRAAAISGGLDRLDVLLRQTSHFAERADLFDAMGALDARRNELERLRADAKRYHAPTVSVVVLPDDFGKKGRGAKIRAWIVANGATWQDVARAFVLAESTSRRYVREAKRAA